MLTLLLSLACTSNEKTADTSPIVELSSCDVPLPVIDWSESGMPTEGLEGVAEELVEIDLGELEDPVDISELMPMFRGIIAYALEISPADLPNELSHERALESGKLGEVVLASLLLGKADSTGIDFTFFRRGFHHYYTCSKAFPLTLDGFKETYGDFSSSDGTVIDSIAKCADRNIIVASSDVLVAESLMDGVVRETEILLQNQRTDGNLEFLVYDELGRLTNRTQFPTVGNGPHVVTASPYACMTCHMNAEASPTAWGYDLAFPQTGPCR